MTEREAFLAYADAVNEHFGMVNQVYNNAGITFIGSIEESRFKDMERVMDVDFWGQRHQGFPPHPIASGDGHIINISSALGPFAAAGQAAYVSAKFAVRRFTEALRQQMLAAGHPVRVTTVHPGAVKTGFARNATFAEGLDQDELANQFEAQQAGTSPQKAARIILEVVRKNKVAGPGRIGRQGNGPASAADGFELSAAAARSCHEPRQARCAAVDAQTLISGVSSAHLNAPAGVLSTIRMPPPAGWLRRPLGGASRPVPWCPARRPLR